MASHRCRDRSPQLDAVLQDPVGQAEEVDRLDTHDPCRFHLLPLADDTALLGGQPVDAGLTAGHHAVDDLLALLGPAGDGGRRPELHVVGMRDDAQGAVPVLGQGQQRVGLHRSSMARPGTVEHRLGPEDETLDKVCGVSGR